MELFAYIDPSTGSLFIQAAIGGMLAAGVALRGFIRSTFYRIKLALSRQNVADEEA